MLRALLLALLVTGCSKSDDKPAKPKVAPVTAGTVQADGVRRIEVEAGMDGYVPATIAGKPGEKLVLVFKRTVEGSCFEQLKTPDGKLIDLPMNKPVDVAVTVPQTGEVAFACGMDMFKGVVVAQPAG